MRTTSLNLGIGGCVATNGVHFGAYIASNGMWGAFGLSPLTNHQCQGCDVKLELLALAVVLGRVTGDLAAAHVVPSREKTLQVLSGVKTSQSLPSWDYSDALREVLPKQYPRLFATKWSLGLPGQPGTGARDIATCLALETARGKLGKAMTGDQFELCLEYAVRAIPVV